jgi:hypothetical protein
VAQDRRPQELRRQIARADLRRDRPLGKRVEGGGREIGVLGGVLDELNPGEMSELDQATIALGVATLTVGARERVDLVEQLLQRPIRRPPGWRRCSRDARNLAGAHRPKQSRYCGFVRRPPRSRISITARGTMPGILSW